MRKIIFVLFVLLLAFPAFSTSVFTIKDNSVLEKTTVALDGKWDFYWHKFIEPSDEITVPDLQVDVPSNWNKYNISKEADSITKTGKGSGTYKVRIKGLKPETSYSFYTYELAYTAYRVFADGKLIFQSGNPDEDWEKGQEQQYLDFATFLTDKNGCVDLTFHVSNKIYRKGGLRESVRLQETESINHAFIRKVTLYGIFSGIFLSIIAYALLLFILKKDKVNLFLGFFVFSLFSRVVTVIFPLPKYFFPEIPFELMLRCEYIAVFLAPAFYCLYINAMSGKILKRLNPFILTVPSIVFLVLDFTLPIAEANRMVPYMQTYLFFIAGLLLILFSFHSIKYKDIISISAILTVCIIGIGTAHEILLTHYVIIFSSESLLSASFVVYAVAQTALLAYLQNKNLLKMEALNESLVITNKAYYRFVPRELLDLFCKKDITEVSLGEMMSSKMAVLSVDIRNFTSISETMDEKSLFIMLNSYLKRIAPIIRNYDGFIEKYLGDGIIAVFPKNACSALKCAVKMQEEMIELRKEFAEEKLPAIKIGIGIHYGDVVIGTGGDEKRMTEISLSEDIDIAIKTEALTKEYKKPVLVSEQAFKSALTEEGQNGSSFLFKVEEIDVSKETKLYSIYSDLTGNVL